MLCPKIIFEDEQLLVVDKPSGVVVNRADTTAKSPTIQDFAEFKISNLKFKIETESQKEFVSRGGIVHRLDKDTSGLLVIARTPETFEDLKNQFKSREVVKKYLALVHGRVEPSTGTINAPIERSPFNRMHFGVFPGGREAQTDYKKISHAGLDPASIQIDSGLRWNDNDFSLLELTPHTGRTHQIRVHLKYINHPIVSDPIYGGRKNHQADIKFCPRLFLHAAYLKIKHPVAGEALEFNSELPEDLEEALKLLQA